MGSGGLVREDEKGSGSVAIAANHRERVDVSWLQYPDRLIMCSDFMVRKPHNETLCSIFLITEFTELIIAPLLDDSFCYTFKYIVQIVVDDQR